MNKKKLYHTSPEEIREIHDEGLFGSQLFFASEPYYMVNDINKASIYEIDADEDDFLDVNRIPYIDMEEYEKIQPIIEDIKKLTGVDDEEAVNLLSERYDISSFYNDLEDYVTFYEDQDQNEEEKSRKKELYKKLSKKDLGDISWAIQKFAGMAAKALGYKGAQLTDEQGTSYLIDMKGREKELRKSTGKDYDD